MHNYNLHNITAKFYPSFVFFTMKIIISESFCIFFFDKYNIFSYFKRVFSDPWKENLLNLQADCNSSPATRGRRIRGWLGEEEEEEGEDGVMM